MNESERAEKILQDVKTIMDSPSNVEKFQLREKLNVDWVLMSCSERTWVGKQLESKSLNRKDDEVKASFGYDDAANKLYSLEFERYKPSFKDATGAVLGEKRNHIVINDPFSGCNITSYDNKR